MKKNEIIVEEELEEKRQKTERIPEAEREEDDRQGRDPD